MIPRLIANFLYVYPVEYLTLFPVLVLIPLRKRYVVHTIWFFTV